MNVTISRPGEMTVVPEHAIGDRVMVNVDVQGNDRAVLIWISPEVAAQWIEALTPLAAQVKA